MTKHFEKLKKIPCSNCGAYRPKFYRSDTFVLLCDPCVTRDYSHIMQSSDVIKSIFDLYYLTQEDIKKINKIIEKDIFHFRRKN